jgi:cobalt-zinc-cadmium efflux system membrane fusion protein
VDEPHVLAEVVNPARMLVEATTADVSLSTRLSGGASLQGVQGVTLKPLGAARVAARRRAAHHLRVQSAPGATPWRSASRDRGGQPEERIQGIVLPAQAVVRNPSNEPIVWIKSARALHPPAGARSGRWTPARWW